MGSVRRVGERGQVTIPKDLREKENISGGDEVKVRFKEGKILIEKLGSQEELIEGYKQNKQRDQNISEEMLNASKEALSE